MTPIMNYRTLLTAVCILVGLVACQQPTEKTGMPKGGVSFFEAQPGDVFEINFQSHGCFHHEVQKIVITRAKKWMVEIVDCSDHYNEATKKVVTHSRRKMASLELKEADAARLDRLLEFYRLPHSGGCTTEDRITIRQRRGANILAKETFVDGSCATYDKKELLTIGQLVRRAEMATN